MFLFSFSKRAKTNTVESKIQRKKVTIAKALTKIKLKTKYQKLQANSKY